MAVTEICCPHCEKLIFLYTSVQGQPMPKGPKPIYLDEETSELIISMIEEGKLSYLKAAEILIERGIPTTTGNAKWYPSSVQREYKKALKRRENRGENT